MNRSNKYQISLIILFILFAFLFSFFFYREIFPEYKAYQEGYVAFEEFRSTYTGVPPTPFKYGVKQIVMKEGTGPAEIDRCMSCHVALEIEDFSPWTIQKDINGHIVIDTQGNPVKVANPNYIFTKLDEKIAEAEGDEKEALQRLRTVRVGDHVYDLKDVLIMHPLMGKETRPFEFHPIHEMGCVSCHGGNGRGLTTEKAHGPVFDGQYEKAQEGPKPQFLEIDELNDPPFSKVFNAKPGHSLLFQTTPLLTGALIEARCVQCHKPKEEILGRTQGQIAQLIERRKNQRQNLEEGLEQGIEAYLTYFDLSQKLKKESKEVVKEQLIEVSQNLEVPEKMRAQAVGQIRVLETKNPQKTIWEHKIAYIGSRGLAKLLNESLRNHEQHPQKVVMDFLEKYQDDKEAKGLLFEKFDLLELDDVLLEHYKDTQGSLQKAVLDTHVMGQLTSDVDRLTQHFQRGQSLYFSQACYACHRIEGVARGGIGPELTHSGLSYPWFLKESLVWPQADLKTSTMPNYHMDHDELEDLMTFLLAQKGADEAVSKVDRNIKVKQWEQGKKTAIEQPVARALIENVEAGMYTFATEGCASCHRLQGYTSEVGFSVLKNDPPFDEILRAQSWFEQLVPEDIGAQALVDVLEKNQESIDENIVTGVAKKGLLEKVESFDPQLLYSFYAPFKFAYRAKNHTEDPELIEAWQDRVRRVMLQYYQQYGLGRLVGPRLNWSGVYRSDQWLMEHFWNPQSKAARSIMPVMPFDDTKFWQLTHMLNVLGKQNRDKVQKIWETIGFKPEMAYHMFCAQCHGDHRKGNGPVAPWIYPTPKNLRNAEFLRNLTEKRVTESILHGVRGGPMAPWGESYPEKGNASHDPVITNEQAEALAQWLFEGLPGQETLKKREDTPKWQYKPQDVIDDLKEEGSSLGIKNHEVKPLQANLLGAFFKIVIQPIFGLVSEYFRVEEVPIEGQDKQHFYIKQKYYTDENVEEGQRLFQLHCAMCHGTQGDGAGDRAETMQDAKPRMLTNLDWLNSRDDLRLLRSIKYGVPGTSMTAFGDVTSAKQRMQVVMYIRSLSQEQKERDKIRNTLFKVYRNGEKDIIDIAKQEDSVIQGLQQQLYEKENFLKGKNIAKNLEVYEETLKLKESLDVLNHKLTILDGLNTYLEKDRELFLGLANQLVARSETNPLLVDLQRWIEVSAATYQQEGGKLQVTPPDKEAQKNILRKMIAFVDEKVGILAIEIQRIEAKKMTPERQETVQTYQEAIEGWNRVKRAIQTTFSEHSTNWQKQQLLINEWNHGND